MSMRQISKNIFYLVKKVFEIFNPFFAKQCYLKSYSSELSLNLHYTTEKRLDTLNFPKNDIEKIMPKPRSK